MRIFKKLQEWNPFYLRKKVAHITSLVEILTNPEDVKIRGENGQVDIVMRNKVVSFIASFLASYFEDGEEGKKNYVEITFNHDGYGPFLLYVQRIHGKTPDQLKKEAEAKLDALLSSLLPFQTGVFQQHLEALKEAHLSYRALKETDKAEALKSLLRVVHPFMEYLQSFEDFNFKIVPGIYKHFKGQYYRVSGVHQDSETLEPVVAYEGMYFPFPKYTRKLSMFLEHVSRDGYEGPRFVLIRPEGK